MTMFAVVRNGAVWKCHDTIEPALRQATGVAEGTDKIEHFQGFDEQGKSAVVARAVVVRVEELERGTNALVRVWSTWVGGRRYQ